MLQCQCQCHLACGKRKVQGGNWVGTCGIAQGPRGVCVCLCPTCGDLLGYKLFIAYCSMPRRSATPPPTPHSNATVCFAVPHLLQLQPTRTGARQEIAQCTLLMQQVPASSATEKKCQMKGGWGRKWEREWGERGGCKVDGGCPLVVDSVKFK